jgi:endonuclease I
MKRLYLLAILALTFSTIYSQPTGYYNGTENKQGEELKSALNDIISGHTVYSYFYSKEIFKLSDADPQNPNNVIMVYTGRSHDNDDYGNGGNQLNREHVWAKSHGDFEGEQPMDGDVHNLKPVDASVNIDKSNLDFYNGGTQHPEATGCYYSENNWEPRDEVKGDIARIIFYMDTRYEGENGELDLTVVDELNTFPLPEHGKLSTLLEWNLMDPPDAFERNRNNVIYTFQNNRNPFIDNPYLAELIWNNAPLNAISVSNVQQNPLVPVATEPVTISATIESTAGNITDATMYYGTSWDNLEEEIDMDGSGSYFFAEIPGQNEGVTLYFKIEAQDGTNTFTTVTYNFYVPKTFTGELTSIYDIQGQQDSSPFDDQVVSTTGIVTANFGTNYFLQDGPGAWNGLFIYDPGRNPRVGDSLVLTGTIDEYYEKTEMKNITGYYYISGNHSLPSYVAIDCSEAGEAYEGVIIQVNSATCTDANYQANYYMWTVNDGTGDLLIHNTNVFEYEPTQGEVYQVTGPLDYDFDEWKIQLRFETDVQAGNDVTAPQILSVEVITQTVIKVQFTEDVEETSAENTANYSINNGVTVEQAAVHSLIKSQVFLTVTPLEGGDYELTVQNIEDNAGNAMEPTMAPFSSTGVNELDLNELARIYPNPAEGEFNIQWLGEIFGSATINLYNTTGMKVYTEDIPLRNNATHTIDTEKLGSGLYFLEIRSAGYVGRTKLIIQ